MLCSPIFTSPNEALCCPEFIPTDLQCKMSSYYGWLYNILLDLQNQAANAEYFGQSDKSKDLYNQINDYHYLFLYFITIYKQRQIDADLDDICHNDKGNQFYITDYQIDCIRKYFMCRNTDISNLLDIFGLNSASANDGINYMHLEENNQGGDNCPDNDELFIINKP